MPLHSLIRLYISLRGTLLLYSLSYKGWSRNFLIFTIASQESLVTRIFLTTFSTAAGVSILLAFFCLEFNFLLLFLGY